MSRDGAFSRAQQTKNWCVGFSLLTQASTQLYTFSGGAFGVSGGLRGPPGASGGLRGPGALAGFRLGLPVFQAPPEPVVGPLLVHASGVSGASGGLRGPPGASGVPSEVSGGVSIFGWLWVSRRFWAASPALA